MEAIPYNMFINKTDYDCPQCFRPINVAFDGKFCCTCGLEGHVGDRVIPSSFFSVVSTDLTVAAKARNIIKTINTIFRRDYAPNEQIAHAMIYADIFRIPVLLKKLSQCEKQLREQKSLEFIIEDDSMSEYNRYTNPQPYDLPNYPEEDYEAEEKNESERISAWEQSVDSKKYGEFASVFKTFYETTILPDYQKMKRWYVNLLYKLGTCRDNTFKNKDVLLRLFERDFHAFQNEEWLIVREKIDRDIFEHHNSIKYIDEQQQLLINQLSNSTLHKVASSCSKGGDFSATEFVTCIVLNSYSTEDGFPYTLTDIEGGRWEQLKTYFRRILVYVYLQAKKEGRIYDEHDFCETIKAYYDIASEFDDAPPEILMDKTVCSKLFLNEPASRKLCKIVKGKIKEETQKNSEVRAENWTWAHVRRAMVRSGFFGNCPEGKTQEYWEDNAVSDTKFGRFIGKCDKMIDYTIVKSSCTRNKNKHEQSDENIVIRICSYLEPVKALIEKP